MDTTNTEDIETFADYLEEYGLEGASKLIKDELIPLAEFEKISLLEAAEKYADEDAPRNSDPFRLCLALSQIPKSDLRELRDIREPLV